MPMAPFPLLCRLIDARLASAAVSEACLRQLDAPPASLARLVAVSSLHLMTPALGAALAGMDLSARLDPELRDYLAAMRDANLERNAALRRQLLDVAGALNAVGIVPVAMKGAIRLLDGLFPDDSWRFMHDLDLLVPAEQLALADATLRAAGWEEMAAAPDDADRHVILVHPEAEVRLELHEAPIADPYGHLLPAARVLARAEMVEAEGVRLALPSAEDQLVHVVVHGMLQHAFLVTGRFVLRDLVELGLLLRRSGPTSAASAAARLRMAGQGTAWDLSLWLGAACLPGLIARPHEASLVAAWLGRRMLLQQRASWLMQLLGPLGFMAARAAGRGKAASQLATFKERLARMLELHAAFRRKTRW